MLQAVFPIRWALRSGMFLAAISWIGVAIAQETPPAEPAVADTKPAAEEPPAPKPKAAQDKSEATPKQEKPASETDSKPAVEAAPAAKGSPKPDADKKPEVDKKPQSESKAAAKSPPKSRESSPQEGTDDERLSRIEKQLAELGKLLQSMKQPAETAGAEAEQPKLATEKQPAWDGQLSKEWLKGIRWRSIGPANMGGRITDLAIDESRPSTWWAATASGGLIKTTNNGISFEHQFDNQATVALGAVAVAKSDPNIVWVGTGENNPRNSVSYGDGVYKSLDGGKTWKNMGLKESFQIGKIVIHPTDPNTVYVGALGRLYGNNEQRGLYKTVDGGETWERIFYVDDRTGIIDLQLHPSDPNTLIIAAWERLRDGFDSWPGNDVPIPEGYDGYDPIRKWGPTCGLYKSTNGGGDWKRLTTGLPTSHLGRIGFDWYRKDPNILYAVVDCENIGKGPEPLSVLWGGVAVDQAGKVVITQVYPKSPAEKGELMVGDVVEFVGAVPVTSFDQILDELRSKKAGDKLTMGVTRGEEKKTLEFTLTGRSNRSRGFQPGVWFGGLGEDTEEGVRLLRVSTDGPAAKSGLLEGDIVTELDGKPAESWDAMIDTVSSKKAGDKLKVKLDREGETKELVLTLEDRVIPPGMPEPEVQSDVYFGIQGQDAPAGGARLTQITKDGPSEKAGLAVGDVIQSIDGKAVENYRALVASVQGKKAGDQLTLKVARATEVKDIVVTLEKRPAPIRPYTSNLGGQTQNIQDQQGSKGFEYGGIYKSTDCGESWVRVNSLHSRPMYFSVIRVDPNDEQNVYLLGVSQHKSLNGGVSFDSDFGRGVHADGHALWIDPRDGQHMIIGVDGGVYHTYDRGARWDHLNTLALGQFYHVAVAAKYPYYVYGGLQDNGTWGGPAMSLDGNGPVNEDWLSVGGGDGFMCRVDPNDPDLVYSTSQGGAMSRRHMVSGERASIRPRQAEGEAPYRFNWNTPFILSNVNSRVFYAAGNYVFRSMDRGNDLEKISPEITLTKRGSATALSESPRDANVLYVGTDDGALWVTQDAGQNWEEIGKNLDLPAPRWVSTVEASRFADGRVYVALDGHRSDDDNPYVFVSEDFGKSWTSLRANLPWGSTRCLRESPFNQDLLLVGTEFAVFASANRGGHWNSLNTNLPTVPVFDFAFHPNNGEVVAATHGRSLWIADLTALNQFRAEHVQTAALYRSPTTIRWRRAPSRGGTNRSFSGSNPSAGASIYYSLPKKAEQVSIQVIDASGQTVRELPGSNSAGLQSVVWDLRIQPPQNRSGSTGRGGNRGGGGGGAGGRPAGGGSPPGSQAGSQAGPEGAAGAAAAGSTGGRRGSPATGTGSAASSQARTAAPTQQRTQVRSAPSGSYRVVLTVDGSEYAQELRLVNDPNIPAVTELEGEEQSYEVWMGNDEPQDQELKQALKQSQVWARMHSDD